MSKVHCVVSQSKINAKQSSVHSQYVSVTSSAFKFYGTFNIHYNSSNCLSNILTFLVKLSCKIFFKNDTTALNSGADFTNGLKPSFGLKFKTLVLNSVKNVSGLRLSGFHKGAKSMDLLSQWT